MKKKIKIKKMRIRVKYSTITKTFKLVNNWKKNLVLELKNCLER